MSLVVREPVTLDEIVPYHDLIDKEDAHLIAGARQTKCEYLVSLDKRDVLRTDIRERFQPLRIVSPKELLSEMIEEAK